MGEKQFHECGCLWTLPPFHLIYTHFWTGNVHTVWLAYSATFCTDRVTNFLRLSACVSFFSGIQFFSHLFSYVPLCVVKTVPGKTVLNDGTVPGDVWVRGTTLGERPLLVLWCIDLSSRVVFLNLCETAAR